MFAEQNTCQALKVSFKVIERTKVREHQKPLTLANTPAGIQEDAIITARKQHRACVEESDFGTSGGHDRVHKVQVLLLYCLNIRRTPGAGHTSIQVTKMATRLDGDGQALVYRHRLEQKCFLINLHVVLTNHHDVRVSVFSKLSCRTTVCVRCVRVPLFYFYFVKKPTFTINYLL